MNRRKFIKNSIVGAAGVIAAGTVYGCVEATWSHVVRERIAVAGIPDAFRGLKIAFLTDLHHGPWTSLAYVRAAVRKANELRPDLILLGGDYCHNGSEFVEPCIEALSELRARHGVFAVLGNHDYYHGAELARATLDECGITEFNNDGAWLERGGQRLRIAGVDDFWMGEPDLAPALDGMRSDERCLLLSHNPDYAEKVNDPRVGLILSGHTHGGQVVFPVIGAPIVPSWHGQKYLRGLIELPGKKVFVSRGLGTITPPVRFSCRPEINLIELA